MDQMAGGVGSFKCLLAILSPVGGQEFHGMEVVFVGRAVEDGRMVFVEKKRQRVVRSAFFQLSCASSDVHILRTRV